MGAAEPKRRGLQRMAEVAAVFLGVGLAFIADNVREDFQEEAAARELAAGMLEDLEVSRGNLSQVRERARQKTEASLQAREHLRSASPTISLDSLSGLLAVSGGTIRQAPVLRSYEQLVSTGLLRRLSPESRTAVAEWVAALETSRDYFEQDLVDFRQAVAFPFWARSAVSFEQMLQGYEPLEDLSLGEPRFPHRWADLHEDRELNDILVLFAALSRSAENSYDQQEERLLRLMDVLQQELR